jgi:hypothetical protein
MVHPSYWTPTCRITTLQRRISPCSPAASHHPSPPAYAPGRPQPVAAGPPSPLPPSSCRLSFPSHPSPQVAAATTTVSGSFKKLGASLSGLAGGRRGSGGVGDGDVAAEHTPQFVQDSGDSWRPPAAAAPEPAAATRNPGAAACLGSGGVGGMLAAYIACPCMPVCVARPAFKKRGTAYGKATPRLPLCSRSLSSSRARSP